jgi:hypothetical protein
LKIGKKLSFCVQKLVEGMGQQIESLEKQLAQVLTVQQQLLEKVNQTSKNSSLAPSSDPPGFEKKPPKQKSGKKRGGQPGHKGNSRDLYPIEECSEVIEHYPEECGHCGATLTGEDTNPYRHQIVEIPPISISERPGVSAELGTALVKQQEKLFELWHRVRDGTLKRCEFQLLVQEIRACVNSI